MPRQITAEQAGSAIYWLESAYRAASIGHAVMSITDGAYGKTYLVDVREALQRAVAALGFDLVEKVTADEARALIPASIADIDLLHTDAAGDVVGRG
jgi:hypothetical protein